MLKKILLKQVNALTAIIAVISVFLFIGGIGIAEARQNNSDAVVSLSQQNDNVAAKLVLPAVSTPTSAILAKLSNTTNYKHISTTAGLEVSQIRVSWTTDAAATTTIKVGLIASTSSSGALADIYWFDEVSFSSTVSNQFNGRQEKTLDYQPSALKLTLSGVTPTGFLTNDISTSTSQFATTTRLMSPASSGVSIGEFPAVGDLVMRVYDQKGTATTSVSTIYRNKN